MRFTYNRLVYPQLESRTFEDGTRVYTTPYGPAPSVTTILSTLPHPELDAWKERVGPEEAARVSKEATTIGSHMHNMFEDYVEQREHPVDEGDPLQVTARQMFHCVKMLGLRHLNEVWGVEEALHVENLYAGRTDLIGKWKNTPSIIDYKTSKFNKKEEYLEGYYCQLAAYRMAHNLLHPDLPIDHGVLLIGMRPNPQFRKPANIQIVTMDKAKMDLYQEKWIDIVSEFHANRGLM